jgi:uncharacterized 2Fe-2S/4Fe-4S cluster protein (DUF4445 family)/DNA-binding GntR family transcriptional regulator
MEMQVRTGAGVSRAETQTAYDLIWQRITTLEFAPRAPLHEQQLAAELGVSLSAVQGALKLLAHEHLVRITPRYGTYVAGVNLADLEQLSELRVELESLAARLAAQRATAVDLAALDAVRQSKTPYFSGEQIAAGRADSRSSDVVSVRRLFDIDHRFHQAISAAAHNRYLAQALETFFGLSLRLWYMALPRLDTLPGAVERHLDLADAIRRGDAETAERVMHAHVAGFYADVRTVLGPSASETGLSGDLTPLSSTEDVEVRRAYARIREQIVTLTLSPGAAIKPERLAEELELSPVAVGEALELLAHEELVGITPPQEHGVYVSTVHLADLDQLSETRVRLEALSARLAAKRATADDLAVLDALIAGHRNQTGASQEAVSEADRRRLLDLDHKLHQAVARAAANNYLAGALDHLFGLSQRLWYLAQPSRPEAARQSVAGQATESGGFVAALTTAMGKHAGLVDALREHDPDRAARIMGEHVAEFYAQVRGLLTARVTVSYGSDVRSLTVEQGSLLSGAIIATGLPLEQPCAGRGTCLKCKVIAEGNLSSRDDHELTGLSAAERASGYRLACRARITGNASVTLAPVVVYSNKIFRTCNDHKRAGVPLGLAIDLGSTTVAAFVTTLDAGRVCAGAAALNQQTAFGADVISRLAAAQIDPETAGRVSTLAISSIVQAVDALKLAPSVRDRIRKVTIVGNCAMHHLLLRYPVDTLAELPFQPHSTASIRFHGELDHNPFAGIFPPQAEVALPPLIGGFVGSDALACLVYYGFDRATGPMAAIDLGTNGEVMVTDGSCIRVGSTAAGPAFEGVNISCGTRAVDGAITGVRAHPDGRLSLKTIGNQPPVGLTGSGLLELVSELRRADVIESSGRLVLTHPVFGHRLSQDGEGVRRFLITDRGVDRRGVEEGEEGARVSLYLTQHDIRELQKAKGAIRATMDTLLDQLGLQPADLRRVILTGSFGSQLDMEAIARVGMIPPVPPAVIEVSANGAGLGAALMLDDAEFARAERVAAAAVQVDLDLDPGFDRRYVRSLALRPEAGV